MDDDLPTAIVLSATGAYAVNLDGEAVKWVEKVSSGTVDNDVEAARALLTWLCATPGEVRTPSPDWHACDLRNIAKALERELERRPAGPKPLLRLDAMARWLEAPGCLRVWC